MKKQKFFAVLTLLCFAFTLLPVAAFADSTEPVSVEISTAEELFAFAEAVSNPATSTTASAATVVLTKDIDLGGKEWTPIGGSQVYFTGEFDGNGHSISNLTQTSGSRMGLFGMVQNAYIHDLTLKNVTFTVAAEDARVGAIAGNLQYWNVLQDIVIDGITIVANGNDGLIGTVAGYVWKSQLGNVDVKNAVLTVNGKDNIIGGHVAYGRAHVWDSDVTKQNSHWLDGTVQEIDGAEHVLQNYWNGCDVQNVQITLKGNNNLAGGFFGADTYNSHSNYFVNCKVENVTVNCADNTSQTVGGFAGQIIGTTSAGTVKGYEGCSVSGTINGAGGTYGGFVGTVGGRACEFAGATADVTITSSGIAGGFVGTTAQYFTHPYQFTNCKAFGDVSGNVAGGFTGKNGLGGDGANLNVTYTNCTASGTVHGTTYAGGFVGFMDTELPETNWNQTQGTGTVLLKANQASLTVTGNGKVAGLIGYVDGVANLDAKEGNKIVVTLYGNSYTVEPAYHKSEDTNAEDIVVIEVETITVDPSNVELEIGDTVSVHATLTPDNAIETVSWTSSDKNVATVDANGTVTAVKAGTATITASAGKQKATCTVTVKKSDSDNSGSSSGSYSGSSYSKRIVMQIGKLDMQVNGKTISSDVAPMIWNGRTMVPIRLVTETLGGTADWNETSRTVTLHIGGKTLTMTIDQVMEGFDTAPMIFKSRTYVPIRYVAEKLGAQVQWMEDSQKIMIIK